MALDDPPKRRAARMPPPLPPPKLGSLRARAAARAPAKNDLRKEPRPESTREPRRETTKAPRSETRSETRKPAGKEPPREPRSEPKEGPPGKDVRDSKDVKDGREPRPKAPRPAFPRKNQQPTPPAFAAQLPLALGRRLDQVRSFLLKQASVREDVYFYGPESGWALRYLHEKRPLCSLHIHDQHPVGILSLEAAAAEKVDWKALSPAARKARQQAHGSPSLLWLDIPLEADGVSDFRAIVRAKLATWSEAGEPDDEEALDRDGDPARDHDLPEESGHSSGDDRDDDTA
jgi:hypothetical protein